MLKVNRNTELFEDEPQDRPFRKDVNNLYLLDMTSD
jgi:hypothetical protein